MGLLDRFKRKGGEDVAAPASGGVEGSENLEELVPKLREGGPAAALAAEQLGQLGDPKAVPALADLLLGRGELGKAIDAGVAEQSDIDSSIGALLAANIKDRLAREAAERALEKIGGSEAEQALKEYRRRQE